MDSLMDVWCAIRLKISLVIVLLLAVALPLWAFPPKYTESAHGSTVYGVSRVSGVSVGNCRHCHEQHKTDTGPYPYLLFDDPVGTKYFCMNCHTEGGVENRSYSYRAGGYTLDAVNDIEELFSLFSKHDLASVLSFVASQWNYNTQYSSPCVACHDPHYAQRDEKVSSSRGWMLRLPSKHRSISASDRLWGDELSERMSSYASAFGVVYQAPYRYGSSTTYEPDGSTITNGDNLVDVNTFCLECHSLIDVIDWSSSGDKHGICGADGDASLKAPYNNANTGMYVLACTDCHEPHGSPNQYLIRPEINGDVLGVVLQDFYPGTTGSKDMGYICMRCHKDDSDYYGNTSYKNRWEYVHHLNSDRPYSEFQCVSCHGRPWNTINCGNCHGHGQTDSNGNKTF